MSGNNEPAPVEYRLNAYRRDKYRKASMDVYFAVTKRLEREWLPHLKEGELKLLLFLKSMTLGNGKAGGDYSISQIIDGMAGWSNGTNLSRRGVQNAIDSLKARGLITAKTSHTGLYVFEINPDWNPTGTNVLHDGNIATLKAGKQPKKSANRPRPAGHATAESAENAPIDEAISGAKFADRGRKICLLPKKDIFQEQTSPFLSEMVAPPQATQSSLPVENQEGFTGEENPNPPKAPLSPAAPKAGAARPMTGDTLERAWKAAWKEGQASGDILKTRIPAPWSKADKANMKRVATAWDGAAYGSFTDFLAFVVTNWKTIMRRHFAWMTNPTAPDQPAVSFVVAGEFLPLLVEAYCGAETLKWVGVSPSTGLEIEWQMENGLTREAAMVKVAEIRVAQADQKQRAQDIATAKRHLAMAELVLDRSRKEVAAFQKHYGPLLRAERERASRERGEFAPAADRDPNAPIIAEQADFSAWDLK